MIETSVQVKNVPMQRICDHHIHSSPHQFGRHVCQPLLVRPGEYSLVVFYKSVVVVSSDVRRIEESKVTSFSTSQGPREVSGRERYSFALENLRAATEIGLVNQ